MHLTEEPFFVVSIFVKDGERSCVPFQGYSLMTWENARSNVKIVAV